MPSITWETATDWNNAVAQDLGLIHIPGTNRDIGDASVIRMGWPSSDTSMRCSWGLDESSGDITDLTGNGNTGNATVTSYDVTGDLGSTGVELDGTDDKVLGPSTIGTRGSDYTLALFAKTGSSITSTNRTLFPGFKLKISLNFDVSNRWSGVFRPGPTILSDDANASTNTWYIVIVTFDSSGTNLELWVNGTSKESGNTSSGTPDSSTDNAGLSENMGFTANPAAHTGFWNRKLSDVEVSGLSAPTSGDEVSLTTATKSFASPRQPELDSLSYSLNGESITLDVIGSPGTGSQETISKSLDGSTSYTLNWSNSHTDFRIKPRLSTSDPTTSPTFNAATLNVPKQTVSFSETIRAQKN